MADITVTPANVVADDIALATAFEKDNEESTDTINAGDVVVTGASGGVLLGDATAAARDTVEGIALNEAAPGQPVLIAHDGDITFDSTSFQDIRQPIVLSPTNTPKGGKMGLVGDLTDSTHYISRIGDPVSDSKLRLAIYNYGEVID